MRNGSVNRYFPQIEHRNLCPDYNKTSDKMTMILACMIRERESVSWTQDR